MDSDLEQNPIQTQSLLVTKTLARFRYTLRQKSDLFHLNVVYRLNLTIVFYTWKGENDKKGGTTP